VVGEVCMLFGGSSVVFVFLWCLGSYAFGVFCVWVVDFILCLGLFAGGCCFLVLVGMVSVC